MIEDFDKIDIPKGMFIDAVNTHADGLEEMVKIEVCKMELQPCGSRLFGNVFEVWGIDRLGRWVSAVANERHGWVVESIYRHTARESDEMIRIRVEQAEIDQLNKSAAILRYWHGGYA